MKVGDRVTLVPAGAVWDEPRIPHRRLSDGRAGTVIDIGHWDEDGYDLTPSATVRWDGEDERPSRFRGTRELALLEVEGE